MSKTTAKMVIVKDNCAFTHEETYTSDCCRYYFNAQHKFIQLQPTERMYFDFLCEHMEPGNYISLKPRMHDKFEEFCKKIGLPTVSPSTLRKFQKHFKKLSLVIPHPENSKLHLLNPRHVFRGTEVERMKIMKYLGEKSLLKPEIQKAFLSVSLRDIKVPQELLDLPYPDDVAF